MEDVSEDLPGPPDDDDDDDDDDGETPLTLVAAGEPALAMTTLTLVRPAPGKGQPCR
jgi:hypothetical protein